MRTDSLNLGRAALVSLSASLAIVWTTAVCIFIQDLAPAAGGPAYALFPYDGELVAIGLTGGLLPLLLSATIVAVWMGTRRSRDAGAPFEGDACWMGVVVIAVCITAFFTVSHALYGGLGLSKLWAFWLVLAGGVAGVDYWWLRGNRLGVVDGAAECYVIGTVGTFASDVIRTLTGLARAPGEAAVWGGGGFLDVLFWFGLYMVLSFVSFRAVLGVLTWASQTVMNAAERQLQT